MREVIRPPRASKEAGDSGAFADLVRRHQDRVYGMALRATGKLEDAEDLAQEVFLRVYRARKSYVPGAKFSTWLFTIANNVAANALRTRTRRREVSLWTSDSSGAVRNPWDRVVQASSGQIPARQLDKAEMRDIVRLALGSLNERQRMAVLLSKFEGMSYADIGDTMEMTPQAVKSLLSRARVNLRSVLEPYLAHGGRPASAAQEPPAAQGLEDQNEDER